jgi:hypothetical protein
MYGNLMKTEQLQKSQEAGAYKERREKEKIMKYKNNDCPTQAS